MPKSKSTTNLHWCPECGTIFMLDVEPGSKARFACVDCGTALSPVQKMKNGSLSWDEPLPSEIVVSKKTAQAARRA